MSDATHPYSALTPDCVLDALDAIGIHGDGRLLALNSYENRVYQVWRATTPGARSFYRRLVDRCRSPRSTLSSRSSTRAGDPVVAPLRLEGRRCIRSKGSGLP